jgi:hypothetical protein
MFTELALPFSAKNHTLENLAEISAGARASLVAVKSERHYLSLNIHDLRAGDVFLYRRPDGWAASLQSRFDVIIRYQAAILKAENSVWTHVGVLDDNLQVWDAMPRLNVRSRPLREVLREKTILSIRRPLVSIDPVRLRTSLLNFSNHDYRVFRIETGGQLASRLLARTADGRGAVPAEGALICSTFVAHVLRRTAIHPFFRSLPIVVPGDFAQDEAFELVSIAWCKIADLNET